MPGGAFLTLDVDTTCALTFGGGEKIAPDENAPVRSTRDKDFHVHHLRLELTLDHEEERAWGTATLTLSPIAEPRKSVELDAVDLVVRKVRDGTGRLLPFEVRDSKLLITLSRAAKLSEQLKISVIYEVRKPKKGLFFIKPDKAYPKRPRIIWTHGEPDDNRYWFPCFDAPNDRITSEVLLTVPSNYSAVSNGKLVSVKDVKGGKWKTFHYVQDVPHVNYLIAIAAGVFDIKRDEFDGVPIGYFVPKGLGRHIDLTFGLVPEMLKFFSNVTGLRYPYAKYDQVVVPQFVAGAMENTTVVIFNDYAVVDQYALPDWRSDSIVAHEMAHQWFGNWITTKNWTHAWLNEAFASYFDPLWYEHKYGRDEFHWQMMIIEQYYFEEEKTYRRPIVTGRWYDPDENFDYHTYYKGAWVLHMLRYVLGDDLWWKAIRHYVKKFGQSNVETSDFKGAVEEATGRGMDWFFTQWVYKGGHPEYDVKWSYDRKNRLVALNVKQLQHVTDVTPLFNMPIEIEIHTKRRKWREKAVVDRAEQVLYLRAEEEPRCVLFDPENWILKTLKFEKGRDELIYQLSHAENIAPRMQACEALGKLHYDEKAVAALITALKSDKSDVVRRAAAKALGQARTEEAKRALLDRGMKDKDSRARFGVAAGLGEFKDDPEVFESLYKMAFEEKYYYPAAAAIQSLAKHKDPRAIERATKALERPTHRGMAARLGCLGLAARKDEKALEPVMKWTEYGKPELARWTAAVALGELGDALENRKREVKERLVELLRDKQYYVRQGAADGLATLADGSAIPDMEKALGTELYGAVRHQLRVAIKVTREKAGEKSRKADIEKELQELRDQNREIREKLAKIEGRLDYLARGPRSRQKGKRE